MIRGHRETEPRHGKARRGEAMHVGPSLQREYNRLKYPGNINHPCLLRLLIDISGLRFCVLAFGDKVELIDREKWGEIRSTVRLVLNSTCDFFFLVYQGPL